MAQFGRAPGLGPGGRRFESCFPDSLAVLLMKYGFFVHKNKYFQGNTLFYYAPLVARLKIICVLESTYFNSGKS